MPSPRLTLIALAAVAAATAGTPFVHKVQAQDIRRGWRQARGH